MIKKIHFIELSERWIPASVIFCWGSSGSSGGGLVGSVVPVEYMGQLKVHSALVKTQCQDEFRNLSGCVIKIMTGGRILQISIARCQIEAEMHSFPTMYGKVGGRCGKNWRNQGFRPKVMPKTRLF